MSKKEQIIKDSQPIQISNQSQETKQIQEEKISDHIKRKILNF